MAKIKKQRCCRCFFGGAGIFLLNKVTVIIYDQHVDSRIAQPSDHIGGCSSIGNNLINTIQSTDLTISASIELGVVRQDNYFLGGIRHHAVQVRLHVICCRESEFDIDAIDADEQFAARERGKHLLCKRS